MSGDAVGFVWRHCPFEGATFLVHLAIADVVNDMHRNQFWMLETELAAKTRLSRRSVTTALSQLSESGWLIRLSGAVAQGRPARYAFVFKDAPIVYETRAMVARDACGQPATRATGSIDASNGCSHNSIELNRDLSSTDGSKREPVDNSEPVPMPDALKEALKKMIR